CADLVREKQIPSSQTAIASSSSRGSVRKPDNGCRTWRRGASLCAPGLAFALNRRCRLCRKEEQSPDRPVLRDERSPGMATAGTAQTKRAAQLLLLAGCLALGAAPASAAPSVEQMLKFAPKQQGVIYTTPSGADLEKCKVELIKGQGKGSGWLLRDP